MKTLEEIERDVEFQILNARQSAILKAGPEFSSTWVEEWDANKNRMKILRAEGCKRKV
jgi:hypothetical protein